MSQTSPPQQTGDAQTISQHEQTFFDQAADSAVYTLEETHEKPIKCILCGKPFGNRGGAKNHVTNKKDAKHRDRKGSEPGVIEFNDHILEEIQVPSGSDHEGTITTNLDVDSLFKDPENLILPQQSNDGSEDSDDADDDTGDEERVTITRGNATYSGTAINGSSQTATDRPIKNPSGVKRRAIEDADSDEWMRFVEPRDYKSDLDKPYHDPVWLKVHLAGGFQVSDMAELIEPSKSAIYQQLSENNIDTVAVKNTPLQTIWRQEKLPRPRRLTPAALYENHPEESDQSPDQDQHPDQPQPEEEGQDRGRGEMLVESDDGESEEIPLSLSKEAIFNILNSDADEMTRRRLFDQAIDSPR